MQAVEDIRLGGAAVEVDEEQVQLRIDGADLLLYTFGNDMVGDASEWL